MKHAFLIIAHNNFNILKYQLKILDEENVAFFIHIDKRAQVNQEELSACVKKASITFIQPKKIVWGHFSQVECELRLISAAGKKHFDYYHLISGVDMPLHTIPEMDKILGKNSFIQYIHFDSPKVASVDYDRIRYFHILPGREAWKRKINGIGIKFQKIIKVDRLRGKSIIVQKGSNWFSITDDLVQAIIRDKKKICKLLKWSFCGDEIFLQTYVINSDFRQNLSSQNFDNDYSMCLRKIDWDRGTPYIFRLTDFKELISAKELFARKFDEDVDITIVEELKGYFENKKKEKRK